MPRFIQKHTTRQSLTPSPDSLKSLSSWLYNEIEDSLSSRKNLDSVWRHCLKMYAGVPRLESRDIPIPNAPNIEITIGAIAADTINAQAVDLIFNTSPFITVRPKPKTSPDPAAIDDAKSLQQFINHISSSEEYSFRSAIEHAILDDIQLGTGIIYIPYVERQKKTKTATILSAGPHFYSIPPEDIIIPLGTTQTIDELPFIAIRFYYTQQELTDFARTNSWDLSSVQPLFNKDWVRSTRETLGREVDNLQRRGTLFDILYCYCYFDIDGDGIDEDLCVVWNHTGRQILHVGYSAPDRRPLEKMVYQTQPHLFYGLGVLQMMSPFEEKLSDIHNFATLNILLANSRVWVGSEGLPETMKIWPGKYIQTPNPREDLIPLQMSDVYPSIWQDQTVTMQLANQRVGINDISRPTNIPSRTPGVTTMSFLQQVNRRFTPAFNSIRDCVSAALRQACYRYQERLLAGDQRAIETIFSILGFDSGNRVINLLKDEKFDENFTVELTAASASTNAEADRQNAIMLTNLLGQYYQRTIELVSLAANPQTPPEVSAVAKKVIASASEVIDRTIRTFDQVRDPATFIIDITDELNSIEQSSSDQAALAQLMQMLGGAGGQPGTQPSPAQLEPPQPPPLVA